MRPFLLLALTAVLLAPACRGAPNFTPIAMQQILVTEAQRPELLRRLQAFATAETMQYAPSPFGPLVCSLTGRNLMITVSNVGDRYMVGYTQRPFVQPVAGPGDVRALNARLVAALAAPPAIQAGEMIWRGQEQGPPTNAAGTK